MDSRANTDSLGQDQVVLWRGVNMLGPSTGQIGRWWSTSFKYAHRFSQGGNVFAASISRSDLEKLGKDASIEAEFQNYLFQKDPPGACRVSSNTLRSIERLSTPSTIPGLPGGALVGWPTNIDDTARSMVLPELEGRGTEL